MLPKRSIEPHEVTQAELPDGVKTIEVILPLNYVNGCMRFVMRHQRVTRKDGEEAIVFLDTHVSTHYEQYLRGCDKPAELNQVPMLIDEELDVNFLLVTRYLRFAKRYIKDHQEEPPPFRIFRSTRELRSFLRTRYR